MKTKAEKLLARAFKWIDKAGELYRSRCYEKASQAADRGMELWGESLRVGRRRKHLS